MKANGKSSILLAVDLGAHEPEEEITTAVELARDLAPGRADQIVVLHVREFSVARLRSMMTEHGGSDGQRLVADIVARLRGAGVSACGQVREADVGHVGSAILDAAAEFNARMIVLSSPRRRVPIGSVAQHLLYQADVPVVVARRGPVAAERPREPAVAGAAS
jgi:nucleotide-binding universal stress UspA family protein